MDPMFDGGYWTNMVTGEDDGAGLEDYTFPMTQDTQDIDALKFKQLMCRCRHVEVLHTQWRTQEFKIGCTSYIYTHIEPNHCGICKTKCPSIQSK
jgi:hypothetical protein